MAGTFWNSTQQRFWMFSKQELAEKRRKVEDEDRALIQQFPLPDRRLVSLFISQQFARLAKQMTVRQQTLATAQVFVRRFYTRVEIRRTNPYLVLTTAFYLAGKMEESPHHIRVIVGEANNSWQEMCKVETSKLGECEFALISALDSQLIVHHPYRALSELEKTFPLSQEEQSRAWSIINDHYLTDLPLLHPPHVIALTAVLLALVMKGAAGTTAGHGPGSMGQQALAMQAAVTSQNKGSGSATQAGRSQEFVDWLAESNVEMEAMADCSQELISLYEIWEHYNEKTCKEQINRFIKARGLDG